MAVNLETLSLAFNLNRTLSLENEAEAPYYIDVSSVRGKSVVQALKAEIEQAPPATPTCQVFTSHIGCWHWLELRRLQAELEATNFQVVYCEAGRELDLADVEISEILLVIAQSVCATLEAINLELKPPLFLKLLELIAKSLGEPEGLTAQSNLSLILTKITTKIKSFPELRHHLRKELEPRVYDLVESINQEILEVAIEVLQRRGKRGLTIIIDGLERVDMRLKFAKYSQPEYLFAGRGKQLKLSCHLVYTLALELIFSDEFPQLVNCFGSNPKVLPMVPVKHRDGRDCEAGMAILRQAVLARAFPNRSPEARLNLVSELFDRPETLDRLCHISGGHIRNLFGLCFRCLMQEDPPFSRHKLEEVIRESAHGLSLAISKEEWEQVREVGREKAITNEVVYKRFLRSLFIFEYHDEWGKWFDVNPLLAEWDKF